MISINDLSLQTEIIAIKAWAENRTIKFELYDGRIIAFPSDRFKLLKKATNAELKEVEIQVQGTALRWENLDEDLTIQGIMEGRFQLPHD